MAVYCDYCGERMTSAPQVALGQALKDRSSDWDVKVMRRGFRTAGAQYRAVFRSGTQYFLLATGQGEEGREHTLFLKKMFLMALGRLGVRKGS